MPDESIPVPYPNTPATTTGAVPPERQAPFSQTTHPSTNAHGPAAPEARHPGDLAPGGDTADTEKPSE